MIRIIFSATICLASIAANAAEAPKLSISGRMDTMAGYVKQNKKFRTTNPSSPTEPLNRTAIVNDTKIDFNIDGKSDLGFKYGGLIRLHADTSTATNSETSVADKTMMFLQHDKIGRFEAGNTPGAGGLFEMETTFFNRGSWGVDGFWSQWVSDKTMRTTGINSNLSGLDTRGVEFIVSPNLLSNYSGNHYSDAPKVSLFTKPVPELTLGVSYIPDMDSTGTVKGRASKTGGPVFDTVRAKNPATFENIFSGGGTLDLKPAKDVKVKASLVGEIGKAKISAIRDLKAFETGFLICYQDRFKFGATYGSWGKSFTLKNPTAGAKQKASYWSVGAGYEQGKFGTSLTYMNSRKAGGLEPITQTSDVKTLIGMGVPASSFSDTKTNKFNNLVLDVDYKLADGLLPYVGVSRFEFKESTGAVDKGYVIMGGTRLLF